MFQFERRLRSIALGGKVRRVGQLVFNRCSWNNVSLKVVQFDNDTTKNNVTIVALQLITVRIYSILESSLSSIYAIKRVTIEACNFELGFHNYMTLLSSQLQSRRITAVRIKNTHGVGLGLSSDSFAPLCQSASFQHLKVTGTKVTFLNMHSFAKCTALRNVTMSYCEIENENMPRFPQMRQTVRIRYLDISRNKLFKFPKEALKDLPHLNTIVLSSNPMQLLPRDFEDIFPSLTTIIMNEIHMLTSQMTSLLFRNQHHLSYISATSAFSLSTNLVLMPWFQNNKQLRHLDMSNNERIFEKKREVGKKDDLTVIFYGQENLESLYLANTRIGTLSHHLLARIFSYLLNIRRLDLTNTGLSSIPDIFKSFDKLELLHLRYNSIVTFAGNYFCQNLRLSNIMVDHNNIIYAEADLVAHFAQPHSANLEWK